jgi:copper transporter 1
MLWNWYTIDACFIASSWHIASKGMFVGSCIGVILLVMSLEFLRRTSKEYDRYLVRQYQRSLAVSAPALSPLSSHGKDKRAVGAFTVPAPNTVFRPNVIQQALRALLHMLQFAVAYFIMLLAMYFNGYIIICIIIGAYLGFFVFGWETIVLGSVEPVGRDGCVRADFDRSTPGGSQQQEATMCCG